MIRSWESKERSVYGSIHFLPDGRSFLTASGWDNAIARWDEKAGGPTWLWTVVTKRSDPVGVSPDGRLALLKAGKTTVRVYDLRDRKELGHVVLPTPVHGNMGVPPDGRYGVATTPSWMNTGKARVYVFRLPRLPPQEKVGEVRRFEGHKDPVFSVAVLPGGGYALSAGGGSSRRG